MIDTKDTFLSSMAVSFLRGLLMMAVNKDHISNGPSLSRDENRPYNFIF